MLFVQQTARTNTKYNNEFLKMVKVWSSEDRGTELGTQQKHLTEDDVM